MFKFILTILLPFSLYSHSLLLNVFDNEDGTITVEGIFNTGETAQGALIKLISVKNEATLYQKRLPDEGELTIAIPQYAYNIILDGGPGHIVIKKGIASANGFKKELIKKEFKPKKKKSKGGRNTIMLSQSSAVNVSIIIALFILIATFIISILNTNRLIKELKTSHD